MSTPPDREFRPHPRPALIGNEGEGCLVCLKAANVVLELRASEAMFLEAHPLAPHGLPLVSRKHIARARVYACQATHPRGQRQSTHGQSEVAWLESRAAWLESRLGSLRWWYERERGLWLS